MLALLAGVGLSGFSSGASGRENQAGKDIGTGAAAFLFPREIGAEWEYEIRVQIFSGEFVRQPDGTLSPSEPKRMAGRRLMKIVGYEPFGASEEPVTCFETSIQGEAVSREYSEVTAESVISFGGSSLAKGEWVEQVLNPPLKTLQADLRRGASWFGESTVSGNLVLQRRFDVLGEGPIRVASGQYDAIRIRMAGGDSAGGKTKRYLWYVGGIGLVRTHTIYYGQGRVMKVESEELVRFTPGGAEAGIAEPRAREIRTDEPEGGEQESRDSKSPSSS